MPITTTPSVSDLLSEDESTTKSTPWIIYSSPWIEHRDRDAGMRYHVSVTGNAEYRYAVEIGGRTPEYSEESDAELSQRLEWSKDLFTSGLAAQHAAMQFKNEWNRTKYTFQIPVERPNPYDLATAHKAVKDMNRGR